MPLKIEGKKLNSIEYHSPIASAQVKSCLMLAGLFAKGKTKIYEPSLSRNHSEIMLEYLNANIKTGMENNEFYTEIEQSQLTPKNLEIVGDISSASFFMVASAIVPNSEIIIKNVGINPTRTGILDIFRQAEIKFELLNERKISNELCADIKVCYTEDIKPFKIEGDIIPRLIDELPVIAVLASQAEGETIVRNAEDLRNKESDRIKCLVNELTKIGVNIEETRDGFIVRGKKELSGGAELESYHDHRLAMSFYIAGLVCKNEIAINGFEWTNISFPEFEELMDNLI